MNEFLMNLPILLIGAAIIFAGILILDAEKRQSKKQKVVSKPRPNLAK
jgi:hypothetical protein